MGPTNKRHRLYEDIAYTTRNIDAIDSRFFLAYLNDERGVIASNRGVSLSVEFPASLRDSPYSLIFQRKGIPRQSRIDTEG